MVQSLSGKRFPVDRCQPQEVKSAESLIAKAGGEFARRTGGIPPTMPPPEEGDAMTPAPCPSVSQKPNLLDQVRHTIRTLHRSPRTEDANVGWIRRYIDLYARPEPRASGGPQPRRSSGAPATPGGAAISRTSTDRDRLAVPAAYHGANPCPCTTAAPCSGVRLRPGGRAGYGERGCKVLQL